MLGAGGTAGAPGLHGGAGGFGAYGGAHGGAHGPAAITLRELPLDLPLREARDAFERAYFEHHLAREHGSMTRVAERTGLERTHLYRKLKQLGIDLSKGVWRKGAQ
jgi:DNA-binding NtrC family response regulator